MKYSSEVFEFSNHLEKTMKQLQLSVMNSESTEQKINKELVTIKKTIKELREDVDSGAGGGGGGIDLVSLGGNVDSAAIIDAM